MTSRREFLVQCSAVTIVATVPAGLGVCSPLRLREVPLDQIGFNTFSRLVGTQFHVYHDVTPVRLELIEATVGEGFPTRRGARKKQPDAFSLIFRGEKNLPLEQDTYPFAHKQIGKFVMFIVPVWDLAAVTGSRYYEAVFNRPTDLATQRV